MTSAAFTARRIVALGILIALLAGCSASATVTEGVSDGAEQVTVDEQPGSGDLPDNDADPEPPQPEPADLAEAAQATPETTADDLEQTDTDQTDSGQPDTPEPNEEVEAALLAEAAIKDARQAAYDEFNRELTAVLHADPFPAETSSLPDPAHFAASTTGNTVEITTTVERTAAPDRPVVLTTFANSDTGYAHTLSQRDIYAEFLNAQYDRPGASGQIDPGVIETVSAGEPAFTYWTRGLTAHTFPRSAHELDPDRWYAIDAVSSSVSWRFLLTTPADLWDLLDTPMPAGNTNAQGSTVRTAELVQGRRSGALGSVAHNPQDVAVTLMTTSSGDVLDRVELNFADHRTTSSVVFDIAGRGSEIPLPDVRDVVQSPSASARHISAGEYSWTATGTFKDSANASIEGPWTAEGRIHDGRYPESLLSMTAADVGILGQLPSVSAPADQWVRRHGYRSVSYVTGMFPELAPAWADPAVDPQAHYIYDPYRVPADLFPNGLDEDTQWRELRTVPEIVELAGWTHARVAYGQVDTEYWNYRHRQGAGIFAWVKAEDPREVFEVTIGANIDGRVERFELRTTDPDGGQVVFDIVIDAVPKEYLDLPGDSPASHLRDNGTSVGQDPAQQSDAIEAMNDFFIASRAAYPVFDHTVRPEHLTLLAHRVRDEPSGAYTPEGDYFNWPDVSFQKLTVARVGEDSESVICLELEDNEWRYLTNTFERFWRGFEHGDSLNDQILRFNTNGWMSVDVYASDGERHPGDPCVLAQAS